LLSIKELKIRINEEFEPQQGTIEVVFSIIKTIDFYVKLEISLEYKVLPKTYYHHTQDDIEVDETPAKIHVQNLQIVGWILTEEQ
jgi:hypothetical protein